MSPQYCKLKRKSHESTKEWMGRLHTKAVDCEYYDYDGRLTKQCVHGLDDEVILGQIFRELTVLKDINEANSDQILMWAQSGGSISTERGAGQYKRCEGNLTLLGEIGRNGTLLGRIRQG